MNGEETLLAEVRRQAETRREEMLAEARARAEESRRQAEEEERRLEEEASRLLAVRLAADRERILGRRRLETAGRLAAAREAWLRRAFEEARERLAARLQTPEWPPVLERLAREALGELGGQGELELSARDGTLAGGLARRLGIPLVQVRADAELPGTVVAVSPDGLRRVDNGIETRLRAAERLLLGEVARLLFAGP